MINWPLFPVQRVDYQFIQCLSINIVVTLFIGMVFCSQSAAYRGYVLSYAKTDNLVDFLASAEIKTLHWHGPYGAYEGLPEYSHLSAEKEKCIQLMNAVNAGTSLDALFYVGPIFLLGNKNAGSGLYGFYAKQWDFYKDYLGSKPVSGPDAWAQKDGSGEIIPYSWGGKEGHYLCINSPEVRKYNKGCIKLIVETKGSGVFYDGPYFADRGKCYCDSCVAAKRSFIEEKKREYANSDKFDYDTCFYNQSIVNFFNEMEAYAKTLKKDFKLCANYSMWTDDPFEGIEKSGQDFSLWIKTLDLIFVESKYGSGPRFENGKIFSCSTLYKFFASYGDLRKKVYLDKTIPSDVLCKEKYVKLAIAEAFSNGGNWVLHKPGETFNQSMRQAVEKYHEFISLCEVSGYPDAPWSRVVIVSDLSQRYYGNKSYFMAVSKFLSDNQINSIMVDISRLDKSILENTDVVILPNLPFLPSVTRDLLLDFFKKNKKSILILGRAGDIDYTGNSVSPLWQAFGLSAKDEFKTKRIESSEEHGKIVYYPIPSAGLPMNDDPSNLPLPNFKEDLLWLLNGQSEILLGKYQDWLRASIAWIPGENKLVVNLLNYDVENNEELLSVPVSVVLPANFNCQAVTVISPDYSGKVELDFSSEALTDRYKINFTLPKVQIYSKVVIAINNKDKLSVPVLRIKNQ